MTTEKHGTDRRVGLKRLADVTQLATRPILREHGFALPAILSDWANIVGEALARDCSPERLARDGTLTIRVAGPVATEIQHREPEILERIATYFGHRAVRRLRLVRGPLPTPAPRIVLPTRTLDDLEAHAIDRLTAPIGDTALRQALRRLGRAVFGAERRAP
ncbi:MAG: DUF721 domain-containing protein [Alphaproteobacteria bacterium]|nr:DUF721 domain-containing protein [Alphaproteobacteria bacterium]